MSPTKTTARPMLVADPASMRLLLESTRQVFHPVPPEPAAVLDGLHSRHAAVTIDPTDPHLWPRLTALIHTDRLPGPVERITVRRYAPGDHYLPHRFAAELDDPIPAGWWVWCCALGDSKQDGLTCWSDGAFIRLLDRAGMPVSLALKAWCWTSPVRAARYTLAIGGSHA